MSSPEELLWVPADSNEDRQELRICAELSSHVH